MTIPSFGIQLSGDLSEIARMNLWLDADVAGAVPESCFNKVKLFLNEAVENTIRYGCEDTVSAEIVVDLSLNGKRLDLVLTDNAREYDPTAQDTKPQATDLESLSIGGLGVQLMRDAATVMTYRYDDGQNILTASFDV